MDMHGCPKHKQRPSEIPGDAQQLFIMEEKTVHKVASCFLEYGDRFLILHRIPGGRHGGKWGLPAGKIEPWETEEEAVRREVYEETGFKVPSGKVEYLQTIDFDFPGKIISFRVYRVKLESQIDVVLNSENLEYAWVTGEECYGRDNLIEGVKTTLERTGHAQGKGDKVCFR